MNLRNMALSTLLWIALLAGLGVWMHFHARDIAEETVLAHKQESVEQWKEQLFPLYEKMDIQYDHSAETLSDVAAPFLSLLVPMEPSEEMP